MIRTQIYLTEQENTSLLSLIKELGISKSELIRNAIDIFLEKRKKQTKKSHFKAIYGMWKDRDDEFSARSIRGEFDRSFL